MSPTSSIWGFFETEEGRSTKRGAAWAMAGANNSQSWCSSSSLLQLPQHDLEKQEVLCRSWVLPGWCAEPEGGRRASQRPPCYLEGPKAEELLQLQGQPLNLCLNGKRLPHPIFVGAGAGCMRLLCCTSLCERGLSSQSLCRTCQRDHGLSAQLGPNPCCSVVCNLVTASFRGLFQRGNVYLGDCICPRKSVSVRKQQALARADTLPKCYLCFIFTPA